MLRPLLRIWQRANWRWTCLKRLKEWVSVFIWNVRSRWVALLKSALYATLMLSSSNITGLKGLPFFFWIFIIYTLKFIINYLWWKSKRSHLVIIIVVVSKLDHFLPVAVWRQRSCDEAAGRQPWKPPAEDWRPWDSDDRRTQNLEIGSPQRGRAVSLLYVRLQKHLLHTSYLFFLFLFLQIKDKHVKQHYFRKSCLYACTKDFKDQLEELQ